MRPFAFGLTGGIASGKSTVSKTFRKRGIPIVDADEIARLIVRPGMPALQALVDEFGEGILLDDGNMDRVYVGRMVFGDKANLARLDATIGPYLRTACQVRINEVIAEGHEVICFDAPLLIEKKLTDLYRPLVVVHCDIATQIRRMNSRNGLSQEEAVSRIAAQATPDQREWHADFMISTDNTMEETEALAHQTLDKVLAWGRRTHPRLPLVW